ncbi:dATP/dGTP diphosphohydrolase domain-containing protein [Amycolatopsis sp. NPDC003731]
MEDSGNRKEFAGGGIRDTAEGKERFELLWTECQPYEAQMLTRAARWMALGAAKYADRNWEQFSGPEALEHAKASLLRHTFKLLAGQDDEDHAAACWFNVQAIELIRWKMAQTPPAEDPRIVEALRVVDSIGPGSLVFGEQHPLRVLQRIRDALTAKREAA